MDLEGEDFLSPQKKGPPIVCVMCKSSRKGDERLFMFGGNRPFMARFESKLVAFIGHEKLASLRQKYKTKRDRSYICKHCYSVVDKTFDSIRKIQRGVAKSVGRLSSLSGEGDEECHSDLDLEGEAESVGNIPKKKLPPVAERIAEKVASMTLVKINNKVPKITLVPVDIQTASLTDEAETNSNNSITVNVDQTYLSGDQVDFTTVPNGITISSSNSNNKANDGHQFIHSVDKNPCDFATTVTTGDLRVASQFQSLSSCASAENEQTMRGYADDCHSSSISADESSSKSREVQPCFNIQHESIENTEHRLSETGNHDIQTNQTESPKDRPVTDIQDQHNEDKEFSAAGPSPAELAEILANPLLMVKTPQPIKLAEVKNKTVYICGESGCDWIFSSRFFWENHIRHYHYYGKPHKCPFEGCNKYFPTKSKQKQHVRKHTGERPFVCEECGKAFRGSQELRHHRGTHTVGKPYQCPKPGCYKSFKYINSMKRHLQFHDGNYPYPCSYPKCSKAFKNKYELKCHYRLHTGERPYKCKEPGCGKAFRLPCEYTKHRRAHTGERPFKCTWAGCSAAYITCGGLASHLLSHSNDQHFCCEYCGKTFKHKMSYRSHLKQHTETSEDFKCKVEGCGISHQSKAQLHSHMSSEHGQDPVTTAPRRNRKKTSTQVYLCPEEGCGKEYVDRRSVDQHMLNKHNIEDQEPGLIEQTNFFTCNMEGCGSQYSTDGGLRYHRLTVHTVGAGEDLPKEDSVDPRKLTCPYETCEREYDDSNSLRDHLAKAHISMPREKMCPLCGLAFQHIQQLELHVQSFHAENSVLNQQAKGIFQCNAEACGLRFSNLGELKVHINDHIANPPYRCDFEDCRRTFLLQKAFNNHILEHRNLKPYICNFDGCTEGFASQLKLLTHSKTHYGCFKCPIEDCGKMLQAINSARIHLFRHTGEKPYGCTVCGMMFAACAQLIRHKRTHTGEKPYECEICHNKFADGGILKIHMRSHSGEKPFQCEECNEGFVSKALLKSHMKIHTGELPFVCPEEGCGKAFRESGSLKSHHNVHSKPSHLCSQCGKVYKFSINKHKCKVDLQEPKPSQIPAEPLQQKLDYVQPPVQPTQLPVPAVQLPVAQLPVLPPPQPALPQQEHHQLPMHHSMLPPPPPPPLQYNMNNVMMMTDPGPTPVSYVAEVEEAARAGKSDYSGADTLLMQDVDRNLMISSPYYNYMILYDKQGTQ